MGMIRVEVTLAFQDDG